MASESSNTYELVPQAQMGIFWRILHLITSRYGNYPMGQTLVALTMVFLNERGMPPTLTDLCEATGLPKASVSRYVSWQIREGLCEEHVDPEDRRRRLLVQTNKGQEEWNWQLKELGQVFNEVASMHSDLANTHDGMSAGNLLKLMKELTAKAPKKRVQSGLVKKK
jgi:DNA-binding MarR family transcriptional regulator